MIIGLGCDICNISRIEDIYKKYGLRFAKRILGKMEYQEFLSINDKPRKVSFLAKRFAAKEAFVKALGIGFDGIKFRDAEIAHNAKGKPCFILAGEALRQTEAIKAKNIQVSLSDDNPFAQAVVTIEN
ncbi:MAG: holo-ACP synthase [Alphaproteobacteria bacterium]|nr:holo-ACP synthase [Alphaproteobacteria bacterium]